MALDLTEFTRGIDQARIHLKGLQAFAEDIGRGISRALSQFKPENIDFSKASSSTQTFNTNITQATTNLKNLATQSKTTGSTVAKNLNFGDELTKNLQKGFEVGLSHAVGAISIGGDPFRALKGELTRNLSISFFNTLLSQFKSLGNTAQAATPGLNAAAASLGTVATEGRKASDVINDLQNSDGGGGGFSDFIKSINFGVLALSAAFVALGSLLDKVGDKLISFTEGLARQSGEANLSFTQLNAVLKNTEEQIGANLGPTEEWAKFIQDLALQSGKSQKELADFGASFVQVGAEAGLSGKKIQELVETAAFTASRFRSANEQLNNFRNLLVGNFKPINTNIFIANDATDATNKYAEALVRQGASQAEAAEQAKKASTSEKALFLLEQAAAPIIDTATKSTGSYTVELRKLEGALSNLQISFGKALEPIFAAATKALRGFIEELTGLPEVLKGTISLLLLFSGLIAEVGGKLLKIIGIIGLVTVALTALNKAIGITIPFLGTSLAGAATTFLAKFIQLPGPLTNLEEIFAALGPAIKTFFSNLSGGAGIFGVISNSIKQLLVFIGNLVTRFLTLSNVIGALKLGGLVFLATALTDAFKKVGDATPVDKFEDLNAQSAATKVVLEILNYICGTTAESFTELAKALDVSQRASAAYIIVVNAFAESLTGLAYAAGLAALSFFEYASAQNKARAADARKNGQNDIADQFEQKAEQQDRSIGRLNKALDGLEKSYSRLTKQTQQAVTQLFASQEELALLQREAVDTGEAIDFLGSKINNAFSPEQIKILDRVLKSLRGEIDQLKVHQIELVSGKAAGEQAKSLLKVKEAILEINEQQGVKLFTDDEIQNAKSAKELIDKIATVDPERAKKLSEYLDTVPKIAAANEALERQKKLFTEIIGSINSLGDSFKKEINSTLTALDIQYKFNEAILVATNNFDDLTKKAQLEQDIRKATLDVDNKIKEVRDKIENGKIEVTATGQTIKVQLNPAEKKKALQDLDSLTKNRQVLIDTKIDENSAKRVTEIISEFQKRGEAINKVFVDDTKALRDQATSIDAFVADLAKGSRYAEDQAAIRARDLDLTNKIKDAQNEILNLTTLLNDESNGLDEDNIRELTRLKEIQETLLARLQATKDINNETAKGNQLKDAEKNFLTSLQKSNETLKDQLDLLEVRSKLFSENILGGEFNKSQERVDLLTNALQDLLLKQIQLRREAESNPGLITDKTVKETEDNIAKLKEALRAANFVNDIRDFLQVIPDALNEALGEGLRGVLQGTQKISDLFRNMASNIFATIAKISLQKLVTSVTNDLSTLAETIAKSDIGKKIAGLFGINVDSLFKKVTAATTPQDKLTLAVEENTKTEKTLIDTINDLIAALKNQTGLGGTGAGTTNSTGPGTLPTSGLPDTGTLSPEALGLPQNVNVANAGSDLSDQFTEDFVKGFEQATQQVNNSVDILTKATQTGLGKSIDDTFRFINTNFGVDFNQFGKNVSASFDDFFRFFNQKVQDFFRYMKEAASEGQGNPALTILGGLTKVFGVLSSISGPDKGGGKAAGGLIPGTPSSKDDRLQAVASGEYITNAQAVKYYGTDLFDSINNMTLPQHFFDTLEANNSASTLAQTRTPAPAAPIYQNEQPVVQAPPVSVVIYDNQPKLDPKKLGLQEDDVRRVYVNGIKKDGVIRRAYREDLALGR